MDTAYEAALALLEDQAKILYAPGYALDTVDPNPAWLAEAQTAAGAADVAVVFIGLTDACESEGYDRTHMGLPANHIALLEAVRAVQENVVVVLSNGSPVTMPWLDLAKGLLEGHLGGQAGGGAIVDVLFGEVNPSGKLAESFPMRPEDTPAYLSFPGDAQRVVYSEGPFVGYRYYDARRIEPLFPFGYGLSYTDFAYTDLTIDRDALTDQETLTVSVTITNTGSVAGKEVAQLYVRDVASSVIRPPKELKGFEKVALRPGEAQTVTFELGMRTFAFWDQDLGDWRVETGVFDIQVGASSRDIRLSAEVTVTSTAHIPVVYEWNTLLGTIMEHPAGQQVLTQVMGAGPFGEIDPESPLAEMLAAMMREMPFRVLVLFSQGRFPPELAQVILDVLNGSRDLGELLAMLQAMQGGQS